MGTSQRILALSKDRGSVQAILPVIKELQVDSSISVVVISMEVSRPLLKLHGVSAEYLQEETFSQDSGGSIANLLDQVKPDLILSGSSPARGPLPETPEQYLMIESRMRSIPSVAVLDFWGMYHQRFVPFGDQVSLELLPDKLCVLDEYCCQDLLALGVPMSQMSVTHNPWMDNIALDAVNPPPPPSIHTQGVTGQCVLYVSQPLAEMISFRPWSYDQYQVLTFLIDALPTVAGKTHRVLVWGHPAEKRHLEPEMLCHSRPDVEVLLVEERGAAVLAYVDLIASSHSTATYEGLYYCTPVISLRPDGSWLEPMHTDKLGLSVLFSELDALKGFLGNFDSDALRIELQDVKESLLEKHLFFNDGFACKRVCKVVRELLYSQPRELC